MKAPQVRIKIRSIIERHPAKPDTTFYQIEVWIGDQATLLDGFNTRAKALAYARTIKLVKP